MMTKIVIVVFSLLTAGVTYATYQDIGLGSKNQTQKSIRYGSGGVVHSGYRYGK